MLVFEERGKPEYPEKNFLKHGRELTTKSTHIWRRRRDLNPGHIGGRRVFTPLRHPCSPEKLLINLQWKLVHEYCVNNYLAQALYCRIHYNCKLHYITSTLYTMSPLTCYTSHAQTFPQETQPHYKCIYRMADILWSECHEISNKTCLFFVILDGCSCKRQSIIACGAHLNIFTRNVS